MERISYKGWTNCYRLSNGIVDLIVTGDVGPRIIRFGFINGEPARPGNEFREYPDQVGKIGGQEWRIYGGHRLWHSPEDKVRTYFPDNFPVRVEETPLGLRVIQDAETTTGIEKQMEISLSPAEPHVEVLHRLRNRGQWPVELAAWCLTVMNKSGMAIVPQSTRAHPDLLLPNRILVLWPYTDMTDPRVRWGEKYITLRQDPGAKTKFKLGISANDEWAAYARGGNLFVKRFRYKNGATYPDWGCSVEVFADWDMLELETVGPLVKLEPGQALEHSEAWFLFKGVQVEDTDDSIDKAVKLKALSVALP